MEERNVIVRCDESAYSDMLIKRLKNYDRRLARHTFEQYEYMSDFVAKYACVVGEIVGECRCGYQYMRCFIKHGTTMYGAFGVGFCDCCFANISVIYGVELYGENISVNRKSMVENVRVPDSNIEFDLLPIERYNEIVTDKEKYKAITSDRAKQYVDDLYQSLYNTTGRFVMTTANRDVIEARKTNLAWISEVVGATVHCWYADQLIMRNIN